MKVELEELATTKQDLSETETKLGATKERETVAAAKCQELEGKVARLAEQIKGKDSEISTLASQSAASQTRETAAATKHQELEGKVAGLAEQITGKDSEISTLESQIAASQDRETAAATKHQELNGNSFPTRTIVCTIWVFGCTTIHTTTSSPSAFASCYITTNEALRSLCIAELNQRVYMVSTI